MSWVAYTMGTLLRGEWEGRGLCCVQGVGVYRLECIRANIEWSWKDDIGMVSGVEWQRVVIDRVFIDYQRIWD